MPFRNVYILFSGLLFIILIAWIFCTNSSDEINFVRSPNYNPEKYERVISENYRLDSRYLKDSTILRPAHIRFYEKKIYISDFSDFSIYEFDQSDKQTKKIVTGRGRGPGEFQNLTDFDIINDTLWAVDSQNMMISSFSLKTNEFIKSYSVDKRPMRITCLANMFIVQWLGSELLFSSFDYEGNEIKNFGKIIDDQLQHTLSLDGTIRSNKKDRFVYIPFYASLIYHFNFDGKLLNVLKTPDGLNFPLTRKEGNMFIAPDSEFTMQNGTIDEIDYLYVHTRRGLRHLENGIWKWEGVLENFIDIFNLKTGKYVKSIEFPFIAGSANFYTPSNSIYVNTFEGQTIVHKIL